MESFTINYYEHCKNGILLDNIVNVLQKEYIVY